jgi:hypothetical protein
MHTRETCYIPQHAPQLYAPSSERCNTPHRRSLLSLLVPETSHDSETQQKKKFVTINKKRKEKKNRTKHCNFHAYIHAICKLAQTSCDGTPRYGKVFRLHVGEENRVYVSVRIFFFFFFVAATIYSGEKTSVSLFKKKKTGEKYKLPGTSHFPEAWRNRKLLCFTSQSDFFSHDQLSAN